MTRLVIDNRYAPGDGIGRYAAEVVSRLTTPWTSLGGSGRPTTPADVVQWRRLQLGRGDLLYSPGFGTGLSQARQLLTIHDLTHLREIKWGHRRSRFYQTYYERLVRPVVRRTGHVITVSNTSAVDIRAWIDDDSVEIHNCGNGCSAAFTPGGPFSNFKRPYFLYVGNFKAHKNPAAAFAAMARIPEADLVVVTGQVEAAKGLAEVHSLDRRVRIVTRPSDERLAELYRGAVALVFPSRWEGFGLPVLEALNCGSRVVYARDCASVAEICGGTQFEVGDATSPDEFANAMARAWEADSVSAPDLQRYDWTSVAGAVDQTLSSIRL